MQRMAARLLAAAGLIAGVVGFAAIPAVAQNGATTIDCSTFSPELGGTIVFTPSGNLLGNCWQHEHSPGSGAQEVPAQVVSCEDALGQPSVGIAVFTPEGSTYINCHIHSNPGQS